MRDYRHNDPNVKAGLPDSPPTLDRAPVRYDGADTERGGTCNHCETRGNCVYCFDVTDAAGRDVKVKICVRCASDAIMQIKARLARKREKSKKAVTR